MQQNSLNIVKGYCHNDHKMYNFKTYIQSFFVVSTVLLIALSCEKEPILDVRDGLTFNPDTVQFDSSLIAWELYSWKSQDVWRFSLLAGVEESTRSIEEIMGSDYTVTGREQFKLLIRQLPAGDSIVWRGSEWADNNIKGTKGIIALPATLTQYAIYSFCERNSLKLGIVE